LSIPAHLVEKKKVKRDQQYAYSGTKLHASYYENFKRFLYAKNVTDRKRIPAKCKKNKIIKGETKKKF
jgi:hypothetical protein